MGAVSVANCAHAGSCLARGVAGMLTVQRIRVPDTGSVSWVVVDSAHLPVAAVGEFLLYLHRIGRSPNTVRAYAHHLQAYWSFLQEKGRDWRTLKLSELAEFVGWVRHAKRSGGVHRSDRTINLILAAVGSFYVYQDRLGVETATTARSRRSRCGSKRG